MPSTTITRILVSAFCLLLPLSLGASETDNGNGPRFTRSECIVKIRFYWPENMPKDEREKLINKLFDEDKHAAMARNRPHIASMRFGTNDRNHLYLQYGTRCDRKQEITEEYLGRQLIENIPGFPRFEILDELVIPHPSRIDSYGPWWIDGENTITNK